MPTNWSTEQLKEFFEMKAVEQDRRLDKLDTSVDTISNAIGSMVTKVNAMWGAIGVVSAAVITVAIKTLAS